MKLLRNGTAILLLFAAALACAADPTPDPELRDALRKAASGASLGEGGSITMALPAFT